jgi:hypothetical protein
MLSMIDTGQDCEAHPAFWAPFVLVGEELDHGLSDNAFEFGLLGNTFVRFIRALDAIQPFVAFGRKQLRYCIYAARSGWASDSEAV